MYCIMTSSLICTYMGQEMLSVVQNYPFFFAKSMWSLKNLFEKFSRNIHCASYK